MHPLPGWKIQDYEPSTPRRLMHPVSEPSPISREGHRGDGAWIEDRLQPLARLQVPDKNLAVHLRGLGASQQPAAVGGKRAPSPVSFPRHRDLLASAEVPQ